VAPDVAEFVTPVVRKEGVYSLLPEVGGTERPTAGTDRRVRQLEPAFFHFSRVVSVPPLEVADDQRSPSPVIGVMTEGLHRFALPSLVSAYPSVVRGILGPVPNEGFHKILGTVFLHHVALRHENLFVLFYDAVPVFRDVNCFVRDSKVIGKEFIFEASKYWLETLAGRLLLVSISAPVNAWPN